MKKQTPPPKKKEKNSYHRNNNVSLSPTSRPVPRPPRPAHKFLMRSLSKEK